MPDDDNEAGDPASIRTTRFQNTFTVRAWLSYKARAAGQTCPRQGCAFGGAVLLPGYSPQGRESVDVRERDNPRSNAGEPDGGGWKRLGMATDHRPKYT